MALPPPGTTLDPKDVFRGAEGAPPAAVWLEIGFGAGDHVADQARRRPDIGFIGCEPFVNGVAALVARIERDALGNVRIFDDDARRLLPALAPGSIGRVFILFPDPWPKRRHHKRRLINRESLDALSRVMADGAELRFATDHGGYAAWTLALLLAHPDFRWTAERARDWRERPADAAETRYESKARRAGRSALFLNFRRRPRTAASPQAPTMDSDG